MKKFIPRFLKYPLITLYAFWRGLTRGRARKGIILNLAGVLPSDPKAIVHGGKVKLLALRERFGDTWQHFSIAYFVSSGLPFAPAIWMRIYKLFGVKVVWNQNGVAYPAWAKEKTSDINSLMKPIHQAHHVIFQTEFTKKCSDKFLGRFQGPSTVLVNPVDTRQFIPRGEPMPETPFKIIMSGHHFESKERMRVSIEAVRQLRENSIDARLIIIGNTQEVPDESWIDIRGKFSQEEAPALYQKAHILLHLKNLDPCPTIVLEALSCGLPVVGLDNGGMPELVDKNSGILIPTEENFEKFSYPGPEVVAKAIMGVRGNLLPMSRGARSRASKFDKAIWLKKHEEIFNNLLK